MKYRLMDFLACPKCRSHRLSVEEKEVIEKPIYSSHFSGNHRDGIRMSNRQEVEIISGTIHCGDCGQEYPIENGIPNMLLEEEGQSSLHRHTIFDQNQSVWKDHFLEIAAPLLPKDFLGKVVVDLGCGYGRHSFYSALYGAELICIDNAIDALQSTQKNTSGFTHRHLIQADARNLPLKSASIDILYCYGLLHHIENPNKALDEMDLVLKAGGCLSLWVYGPRQGATLQINNLIRSQTADMSHDSLLRLAESIARFLRVFSHTPYRWFGNVPYFGDILSHLPVHDHHKWPFDVVVADIYDRLRVKVLQWFTKEDLEKWYGNKGYSNISVRRRIRNNETFCCCGWKR